MIRTDGKPTIAWGGASNVAPKRIVNQKRQAWTCDNCGFSNSKHRVHCSDCGSHRDRYVS